MTVANTSANPSAKPAAKPADRWSAFITDRAAAADAEVIVDVQAMAPALRTLMEQAIREAQAEMQREMAGMPAGMMGDPDGSWTTAAGRSTRSGTPTAWTRSS